MKPGLPVSLFEETEPTLLFRDDGLSSKDPVDSTLVAERNDGAEVSPELKRLRVMQGCLGDVIVRVWLSSV